MSGDYLPIVGEDEYSPEFQEIMNAVDPFFYPSWAPEFSFYNESAHDPLSDLLASTGYEPYPPLPHPPQPEPGSPPDEPELSAIQESDLVEAFFTFNTPPPDTVSPADLTPTTPGSPDSNSSPTDTSLATPRSQDTDDSRASTNPSTPDSPDPESYEPVQTPANDWECTFPRCLKRYRRRCDVNKHCKTHTKPFACSTCGQKSSSKRDKERHELSHRSEHPQCPHPNCTSSTSRKDNMRDHIKRKHKDMDPKDPAIDALYSKRPRIQGSPLRHNTVVGSPDAI